MNGDGDNETLGSQLADSEAGQGTADTETVDQDRGRNQLVGGDLLNELVVGGLVEDDGVVGLILNLTLGPFLYWMTTKKSLWVRGIDLNLAWIIFSLENEIVVVVRSCARKIVWGVFANSR